jgi:hypothetical protein
VVPVWLLAPCNPYGLGGVAPGGGAQFRRRVFAAREAGEVMRALGNAKLGKVVLEIAR